MCDSKTNKEEIKQKKEHNSQKRRHQRKHNYFRQSIFVEEGLRLAARYRISVCSNDKMADLLTGITFLFALMLVVMARVETAWAFGNRATPERKLVLSLQYGIDKVEG